MQSMSAAIRSSEESPQAVTSDRQSKLAPIARTAEGIAYLFFMVNRSSYPF
jgi:hypothetical protein